MRRAIFLGHLRISLGTMILVADENCDGRAEGFALKGSGENLALIGFVPWSCDLGLSRASAIELDLEVSLGEGNERRAAVDNDTDPASVGFTKG
jgi:hypothetical protein